MNNVCKFLPPPRTAHQLQTVNFVYETHPQSIPPCPHATVYRAHLVTEGTGEVHLGNAVAQVKAGDIFFTLPAMSHHIQADNEMKYLYISYIGVRAAAEAERCSITPKRFVFEGLADLEPFWQSALQTREELIDLAAESVLLYTLARIGGQVLGAPSHSDEASSNFELIKGYIDAHFCEPTLCTKEIGEHFSYNAKYISTLFKKRMKVGISEYIRTLRLNRATALLERGELSVAEIAREVGFRDPLYFSKLFKAHSGLSPTLYQQKK